MLVVRGPEGASDASDRTVIRLPLGNPLLGWGKRLAYVADLAILAAVIAVPTTLGSSIRGSATATPTTVRFFFKAKATKAVKAKAAKAVLRLSGAGALMFPDAPAEGVLEQAPAVQGTVIIRRGASSATFTFSSTGARYVFSTRIGILFQEVGLIGQITRSTIRACRVGSAGAITVETEENLPSRRGLFRVGSFADNVVVFRICAVRGEDPGAVAKIVATP